MTGVVQMRDLGTRAQFGNTVIAYAALRTYAKRHGLQHQCPSWVGTFLFGHDDPPIDTPLPDILERYQPCSREEYYGYPIPPYGDEWTNRNVLAWCQFHTSWFARDMDFVQDLFQTVDPMLNRVHPALEKLRSMGDTIISIHLRRGDSGRAIFPFTPITWFLKWLHFNFARYYNPVLFIATETPSLVHHFRYYNPVIAEDLGISITGSPPPLYTYPHRKDAPDPRTLDFFPDYYILQNSDVVVASESTFSISAAWTSKSNVELWVPRLSTRKFHMQDPWNMNFLSREHLDDFPGIPGTQIDTNPQFANCWGDFKPKHPSIPEDPKEIAKWEPR